MELKSESEVSSPSGRKPVICSLFRLFSQWMARIRPHEVKGQQITESIRKVLHPVSAKAVIFRGNRTGRRPSRGETEQWRRVRIRGGRERSSTTLTNTTAWPFQGTPARCRRRGRRRSTERPPARTAAWRRPGGGSRRVLCAAATRQTSLCYSGKSERNVQRAAGHAPF